MTANQGIFSQNDLSFLGGNTRVNNFKEDFLTINPKRPEVYSELKEKVYYCHVLKKGFNLIKVVSKGYIGINIVQNHIINNKEFYINFITDKWKDHEYFKDRDMNQNIQKVTEMIYKIRLVKQQGSIKLITYSINQNIMANNKLIDVKFKVENNNFLYKFIYNINNNCIYKIDINIGYKTELQNWNMVNTDGLLISSKNNSFITSYNRAINEGKIIFPMGIKIGTLIGKISIKFQLIDRIVSNMNVKINFSNSRQETQETLLCKKIALVCLEYA